MDANFITSLYIKDNTKFGKSQICGPMKSAPRPALAGHFGINAGEKEQKKSIWREGKQMRAGIVSV